MQGQAPNPMAFGILAAIYFAVVVAVVVLVVGALRRMARAQEQIAERLAGIERALTGRGLP